MATETIIKLTDSLDERISTGVETVTFFHPMTGQKMEIELGEANRKHFGNHLAKMDKYFEAAEVVAEPVAPSKPKAAAKNTETTKIREWARENGFTIGDRGRISAEIMEAYKAAQEVIETVEPDADGDTDGSRAGSPNESDEENAEASAELIDEAIEVLPNTDAEILAMMAQIEAEHGEVTEESLKAALDSNSDSE